VKLIFAVTERDLAHHALSDLTGRGFPVTLIHEEGGFLIPGQGTLMIGVPDGAADFVIGLLVERCGTTMHSVDSIVPASDPTEYLIRQRSTIVQGGLAIFVMTVSRFERFA
jgi:uncharacterized protein YaaQ